MNSSIICLREDQSSSSDLDNKGEYTVQLQDKNLTIKDGDVITFKSAFIDTRNKNAGDIEIDDSNNTISMSCCLYMNNFRTTQSTGRTISYKDGIADSEKTDPDMKIYVLSEKHPATGATILTLKSAPITAAKKYHTSNYIGGFTLGFITTSADGQNPNQVIKLTYPRTEISIHSSGNVEPQEIQNGELISFQDLGDVNDTMVYSQSDSSEHTSSGGKYSNDDTEKHYFSSFNLNNVTFGQAFNGETVQPIVIQYQFKLNNGFYSPSNLAKTITDKIANVRTFGVDESLSEQNREILPNTLGPDSFVFPSLSQFYTSTKQVNLQPTDYDIADPNDIVYVAQDGQSIMEQDVGNAAPSYALGSNQISLEYNEDIGKFQFTALHTSHYDNSVPVVRYIGTTFGAQNVGVSLSSSVSGLFFTNLSPHSLFFETMGFDPSIEVKISQSVEIASMGGGAFTNIGVPSFPTLQKGVNITSDLSGVDAGVQKNFVGNFDNNANVGSDIVPNAIDLATVQVKGTTTTNLTTIPASKIYTNTIDYTSGYYLIQIDGIPTHDLYNFPNDKIQGIISRYYSAGSFTVMEGGEGGFNYQYRGKEFTLGTLRVRIVDPDGNLIVGLGNGNAVFLEILRNSD